MFPPRCGWPPRGSAARRDARRRTGRAAGLARGAAGRMKSPGVFVAIVGPSGAGKDSLIRGLGERLTAHDDVVIARRVVTRPSDDHEDHDTMEEAAFEDAEEAGRFALSWSAHGLSYGVPVEIDAAIEEGKIVVCNVSRAAVAGVRQRYICQKPSRPGDGASRDIGRA